VSASNGNGRERLPITWPEVLDAFNLRHIENRCKSARSKELHYARARSFCDWAEAASIGLRELPSPPEPLPTTETAEEPRPPIRAWDVDTYLAELANRKGRRKGKDGEWLGLSPGTLHGHARVIKTLLRWTAKHGITDLVAIAMPSVEEKEIEYLSDAQQAHLLGIGRNSRERAFLRLALDTGGRLTELLGVDWKDLDFANGLGTCRLRTTKGGKPRTAFFRAETWTALLALAKSYEKDGLELGPDDPVFISYNGLWETPPRRMGVRAVAHEMKDLSERAGFKVRCHKLRHSCGRNLARAGVPPQAIQKILGHRSLRMVERYTALSGQDVQAAYRAAMAPSQGLPLAA
jgi:integrase